MANFCINCGKRLKPNWQFCPYCSIRIYHVIEQESNRNLENQKYGPSNKLDIQSKELDTIDVEKEGKKRFTKLQKRALIIGIIVLAAVIITPVTSILIYKYYSPEKKIHFYVNNGQTLTSYTVSTSRAILDFFESEPHPSHTHWDPYYVASVIESYCTPYYSKIIEIAEAIKSKCYNQYDSEEIINALLSFTQAIGYKAEFIDLAKFPIETIFKQGDCEDLSILFGSLVVSLGYEAILVIINYYDVIDEAWFGHACVGVYLNFTPIQHYSYPPSHSFTINSKEYWICETTSQGWMIGQLPTLNPSHYVMEGYAYIS